MKDAEFDSTGRMVVVSTGDGLIVVSAGSHMLHLKGYDMVAGHIVPLEAGAERLRAVRTLIWTLENDNRVFRERLDIQAAGIKRLRDQLAGIRAAAAQNGLSLPSGQGGELMLARGDGDMSLVPATDRVPAEDPFRAFDRETWRWSWRLGLRSALGIGSGLLALRIWRDPGIVPHLIIWVLALFAAFGLPERIFSTSKKRGK